jgi:hypothetical protein
MIALQTELKVLLNAAPGAPVELREFIEQAFLLGVIVALEQKGRDRVAAAEYAQQRFGNLMKTVGGKQ